MQKKTHWGEMWGGMGYVQGVRVLFTEFSAALWTTIKEKECYDRERRSAVTFFLFFCGPVSTPYALVIVHAPSLWSTNSASGVFDV